MELADITRTLRSMAWSRAKGELCSMLDTFHTSQGDAAESQYERLKAAFQNFVKIVEDHGLQE